MVPLNHGNTIFFSFARLTPLANRDARSHYEETRQLELSCIHVVPQKIFGAASYLEFYRKEFRYQKLSR